MMFHYYPEYKIPSHPPYDHFNEIRLSIFFITAVCVGLPCLIWAFYFVHLQRKTRGRISAFIILLLLSDLIQLLLYPYILTIHFSSGCFFRSTESIIIDLVSFCLKICSLHLQQLVALEGVLTLKYPQISACIFSIPGYITITIVILVLSLMFTFLSFIGSSYVFINFGSILAPVCLLVVTGIITYKASPTPACTPATENRPGASLFLVTMVTLVLYLPYVLLYFNIFYLSLSWYVMSYCLVSLTVISEPLLCALVCRENLSIQTKQTHIELDSEHTAV